MESRRTREKDCPLYQGMVIQQIFRQLELTQRDIGRKITVEASDPKPVTLGCGRQPILLIDPIRASGGEIHSCETIALINWINTNIRL